jgi:hypothetical protein
MDSLFFLSLSPLYDFCGRGSGRGEEPGGARRPPPDSNPFNDCRVLKKLDNPSRQFAASENGRFEFDKRRQLFIRMHDETLSVNYAVKSSFLLGFLESVPEVSAKLKEPNAKDKKFDDVVETSQRSRCPCAFVLKSGSFVSTPKNSKSRCLTASASLALTRHYGRVETGRRSRGIGQGGASLL